MKSKCLNCSVSYCYIFRTQDGDYFARLTSWSSSRLVLNRMHSKNTRSNVERPFWYIQVKIHLKLINATSVYVQRVRRQDVDSAEWWTDSGSTECQFRRSGSSCQTEEPVFQRRSTLVPCERPVRSCTTRQRAPAPSAHQQLAVQCLWGQQ